MIVSTNKKKAFNKIQHLFMKKKKKSPEEAGKEGSYLNKIKAVYVINLHTTLY